MCCWMHVGAGGQKKRCIRWGGMCERGVTNRAPDYSTQPGQLRVVELAKGHD